MIKLLLAWSMAIMTSSHTLALREMMLKLATPEEVIQAVILGWRVEDTIHTVFT